MGNTAKPRIAIFTDVYLPGHKGGGPIRTIEAIVKSLDHFYDFYIFTRDRDLGDSASYEDIQVDTWVDTDSCKVIYLSPGKWSMRNLENLIQLLSPQIVYLNSFFSPTYSQKLYILKMLGRIEGPILLAPRGEFSPGALKLKSLKKRVYLSFYKHLYKPDLINWHASTEYELKDILRVLPSSRNLYIAEDVSIFTLPEHAMTRDTEADEEIRLVFISRISPKKNLDFALGLLQKCRQRVLIDVYGPIEDTDYWKSCLEITKSFPDNVKFSYRGLLSHEEVQKTFSKYDIFLFPTHGENFGHVIVESLASGCLVMTSKNVPWDDLEQRDAGWNLDLDVNEFLRELKDYASLSQAEKNAQRGSAVSYAQAKFDRSTAAQKTANIFDAIIGNLNE